MDKVLKECIDSGCVVVYIDNVMIFHSDLEVLWCMTCKVLGILWENKLYTKPEKCEFEVTQVEFLGLVISQEKISMDPVKLQGILGWPMPKNLWQLHSFIGFLNFYCCFVQGFAIITCPLNDLTWKDVLWKWKEEQQKAFETLKSTITSAPVLSFPDHNKPKMVETDASKYAYGAVLSQLESNT